MKPVELKCEYRVNPTGIDVNEPFFSWLVESGGYNLYQGAFRILVASSMELLLTDQGSIWDSGKIQSDKNSVEYSGKSLSSNCTYFWKVMIWNEEDIPSLWSNAAVFTTGIFGKHEWKAKWISHRYTKSNDHSIHFEKGVDKWIWHPLSKDSERFKSVILNNSFDVPENQSIQSAEIIITADEKFRLWINDIFAAESDNKIFSWSRPVKIKVKDFLKTGKNFIKVEGLNSYVDDPGVMLRLEIKYLSGKLTIIKSDSNWQSSFIDDKEKVNAKEVRSAGEGPYYVPKSDLNFNPAAYFRKTFKTTKRIKRAFAYCTSLGLYKISVNGSLLSNSRLLPGWSNFDKRVYYNTYEITSLLKNSDKHIVNVILADGYYSGYCGWERGRGYFGKYPLLKMQLMITFDDNTEETICTNEEWISCEGPIREADILMGEFYDSDYESLIKGWDSFRFNESNFKPVVTADIERELTSYKADEIKPRQELKPVEIKQTGSENFVIDFGQNFAGYVRLCLKKSEKRKIVLRFSEMLNLDGSLYTENLRMARSQDTYISNGNSVEQWEPLFTYHGFQYVEISGIDAVDENTITGISINSLPEQTGFFISSSSKLNKLYKCINWNQKSNYIDLPTDCPQRDERFGWTGDAVSFFRTAAFNYDVSSFYNKWFENLYDDQIDGQLPPFAPLAKMGVGPIYFNSAGWADAGIITVFQFYQFYNNTSILAKYYDRMKLFAFSLIKQSIDYILPEYGYGDWLNIYEETSKSLISTAYFAYDISIMKIIAGILNKPDDVVYYDELYKEIKNSFRKIFLENGTLKSLTQTAAILTLYFNLSDAEETAKIKSYLVNDIINKNYHVTSGFLGLSFLMPVLSFIERDDIAWKVLTNNEYPSWFYMIEQGATTLWERWDSRHPDKGFYDPTMNSFNHCSLGCIGEWLYTGLAGIKMIEPGFKKIKIKPFIPEDLDYAEASFKSINGIIRSYWQKEENCIRMNITVPFNTLAEIIIPSRDYHLESNHKILKKENSCTYIEVGSGSYEILVNTNKEKLNQESI